jgi:hypothetical protein
MGAETYRSGGNPAVYDTGANGGATRSDGERAVDEVRSIGRLFADLSSDMSTLLRKEVQLAQAETMEKVRVAAQAGGMMGAGGAVAYAGLILVLVALAFLLANWMEFWIAAGIVGLVALVIGVVLLLAGRNRLKETQLAPEKTIDSVKDIVNDMKETVR